MFPSPKHSKLAFCCLLYLLLPSHQGVFGANILFLFGGGNISHKISIWPFVFGLAEAGHNVTFVSSSNKVIRRHPQIRDVTPKQFVDYTTSIYYSTVDRIQDRIQGRHWDVISPIYERVSQLFCEATFKTYTDDPVFRDLFKKESQIDLVIVNAPFNECTYYLVHRLGVKFIVFSSTTILPWLYKPYGAPPEASTIPDFMARAGYPLGILDRMWNVYRHHKGYSRRTVFTSTLEEIYRQNVAPEDIDVPPLFEIERNASLVFLNSHYSIDFARSLPPIFVNIGGMQCWEDVGQLPKEFQKYMDDAEEGVVIITFGSTINLATLDSTYVNIFFKMMMKFDKVKFIWRWDGSMPEGHPPNIMASNWLPQREILNHPNTVAFMTHGGLNSINEATYHGVPLIVIPLYGDQDMNAYRIQAQRLGVSIEITKFSQELLDSAVYQVLHNSEYKKNMMTRSRMFKDRIQSPIKEAVAWTEFVLRQDDTSALKPMLLDQPWCIRNSVDAYAGFLVIFAVFPLLLLYGITRSIKSILSRSK